MKRSSLLLLSASLLPLTACDPADDPIDRPDDFNAVFSTTDDAHRARAVGAALGFDYAIAYFVGGAYAGLDDPDGCPRIVTEGSRTTVTGGCTGEAGRFDGSIVLDNVGGLFGGAEPDPTRPQVFTFDGYEADGDDGLWTIDGTIRLTDLTAISAQIALGIDGLNASSDLRMTCDDVGGSCTAGAGSWVDVEGVGTAAVSGTWHLEGDASSGSVTLTGAEVLVADLGGSTDGCIPYTIDGVAAGELCDPSGVGE